MARSVTTIYNAAVAQYVANATAAGVNPVPNPAQWSMYNYQSLIFWTMAFCQSLLEQIQDAFTTDVENIVATASPQSYGWLQAMMLQFQYSALSPQIIQFNTTTFAPYYPTVNAAYQVIAYCSVQPGDEVTTLIKVAAKDGTGAPTALSGPAALAAQTYANTLGVPGILYYVTSTAADELFMQVDVFYNGLYSSVIKANVIAAINGYMLTQSATNPNGIPFNGVLTLSNLEAAIKAVPGVTDIMWGTVIAGQSGFSAGTFGALYADASGTNVKTLVTATYGTSSSGLANIVETNTQKLRNWQTEAGYIIPMSTPGYTLTDYRSGTSGALNLNLIAQ